MPDRPLMTVIDMSQHRIGATDWPLIMRVGSR
jgi:hypothetical protein